MPDFSVILKDLDDNEVKEMVPGPAGEPKPVSLTLGRASSGALVANFDDERNLSGDEKVKRWQLALRVRSAGAIELKAEDVALIKKCIAKAFTPMVVGQCWMLLDPAAA